MRRPRMLFLLVAGLFIIGSSVLLTAGTDEVTALVAAGRYEEARTELAGDPEIGSDAASFAVDARLERDPAAALAKLSEGSALADGDPEFLSLALDAAGIHLGRGRPDLARSRLAPLLADDGGGVPGQVLLLAGLGARGRGDDDEAERLLAGVQRDDPAFAAARVALGEISLDRGDGSRALRYFDSVPDAPRAQGGRWRAMQLLGRTEDADYLLRLLENQGADGLALLEIRTAQRRDDDESHARAHGAPDEPPAGATVDRPETSGRYTLQLGAWSDRSRALDMMRRHAAAVPNLRIDIERDARGQILYKVRAGAWDNPALARTEARRLSDRYDLEVFVADRGD